MQMHPDRFVKQERGPYRFDRWHWPEQVPTALGNLVVELTTSDDEPPPDVAMATVARELAEFAAANGDLLLDLVYGQYRYAEENDWLEFWDVPAGLPRNRVLSQVDTVELTVRRGDEGKPEAAVYVDPRWDQEHKLDLIFRDGRIVAVNDDPFVLDGGVLRPA